MQNSNSLIPCLQTCGSRWKQSPKALDFTVQKRSRR
jgi:hypothetical protein